MIRLCKWRECACGVTAAWLLDLDDLRIDMCTDMCVDMWVDMWVDMCTGKCIHTCADMCTGVKTCADRGMN